MFGCYEVLTVPVQVLISVCWFSVDCSLKCAVGPWCDLGVQEGKKPTLIWFHHCELYVRVLCVDVVKKLLTVFCLLDDKGVIHKPEPQVGGGGSVEVFDFKYFHEQVGSEGADGVTHGYTVDLFIILTLEEEVSVFEAEIQ